MFDFSVNKAKETGNFEANTHQWNVIEGQRKQSMASMAAICNQLNQVNAAFGVNAQRTPQDLYRAFDTTVTRKFEPAGKFTILDFLLPRSRSVVLQETKYEFARVSDAGRAQTSMSGQIGTALDAVKYSYDGTMVPVHDTGFKLEWRDSRLQKVGAFDVIADNQYESVDTIKLKYVDYVMNGFKDKDGNFVNYDGVTWKGFRGDERVDLVDLSSSPNIDFTSAAATAQEIRNAMVVLRDRLAITNNVAGDMSVFVSREIRSNFERYYSDTDIAFGTIYDAILKLEQIGSIQVDPTLTGNQMLIVSNDADKVAPIVGSAIATVADPRQFYNSDYVWRTWGAMGIMCKTDFFGRKSILYAEG